MKKYFTIIFFLVLIPVNLIIAQENINSQFLNLDRIHSGEFSQNYERTIQWIENGNAYVIIEKSKQNPEADKLVRYDSQTQSQSEFVSESNLVTGKGPLKIEGFSLSEDGSKVLIFTNSSRVWRSNTKGDYWVFDRDSGKLKQLGISMEPSSLMFAKFSSDNKNVFYVHKFNIYKENFQTGEIDQLTADGDGDIINGTFDWVYEEEFGKRDGFSVSNKDSYLAFWHLDASDTGVFYMINNTDSIYSRPIPVQYPKVGQDPSAAKIGVIDLKKGTTVWVPLEGGERENYIPGMQWVSDDLLLIQQMNRHQNRLIVWSYIPSTKALRKVYTEKEET
ncbi:MAG: DPP IV N-terminal domain-containing protein, partial [Flavobacteriaceae bacterium]